MRASMYLNAAYTLFALGAVGFAGADLVQAQCTTGQNTVGTGLCSAVLYNGTTHTITCGAAGCKCVPDDGTRDNEPLPPPGDD